MTATDSLLAEQHEWPLDADLLELRAMVRDFVASEIRPRERNVHADAVTLAEADLAVVREKAKQAGLWCVASPEQYGGGGFSVLAQTVVAEEAARCRMGLEAPAGGAFGYDPPSVIFGGTREQIEKFAVPTIACGGSTFVALTEPSGGSDPARSVQTFATQDGDDWILNGSKMFISGAESADWGIVFARTDRSAGRAGISSFIVDTGRPGFTATPIPVIRSWYPCEVHFDDYRIPGDQLLGEPGEGFTLAQKWLGHGRVRYAAVVLGAAAESIAMASAYARERQAFGGPLADKQGISFALADCEVELRAARLLVYAAAIKADRDEPFQVDASVAKLYATEAAGRIVDRCIQVFGGMGVSQELPLERWYRELRIKRIGEGPSEIHRMLIARSLIGLRKRGSER